MEILLKTLYYSIDPYLRDRINHSKSYTPPFELNKSKLSSIIADLTKSKYVDFQKGCFVSGMPGWKEYQTLTGKYLEKVDRSDSKLSIYLGILEMTNLTDYLGLTKIGIPKKGETIIVSKEDGVVNKFVGKINKLLDCNLVGITGSDEKVALFKSRFKFNHAINYKTTADLKEAMKSACPYGVDFYFDNVGWQISDAVLANINKYDRLPVCGAIFPCYETKAPLFSPLEPLLLTKNTTMLRFIIGHSSKKFPNAIKKLAFWIKNTNITLNETIVKGYDNIAQVSLNLFDAKNEKR